MVLGARAGVIALQGVGTDAAALVAHSAFGELQGRKGVSEVQKRRETGYVCG